MRLVLPMIIAVLLTGCTSEPDCDVMSEKDTPSPDGRYIATVFEVTCHDTTGYTPHAHLRRAGQKRAGERGNLLVGSPTDTFKATWTATNLLLLEYQADGNYIHPPPASTNIDGVIVTFKRLPK